MTGFHFTAAQSVEATRARLNAWMIVGLAILAFTIAASVMAFDDTWTERLAEHFDDMTMGIFE